MARPRSKVWDLSNEEFEALVKRHQHVVDILEELGFKRTSGSMAKVIKARIAQDGVDTSHMSLRHTKGTTVRIPLEQILVKNSSYTNLHRLKIRLVNEGKMQYKCSHCSNTGEWNGKPLSLELDHIDGDHKNNELSNLRFLCPNCHSQTPTFSGRNKNKH